MKTRYNSILMALSYGLLACAWGGPPLYTNASCTIDASSNNDCSRLKKDDGHVYLCISSECQPIGVEPPNNNSCPTSLVWVPTANYGPSYPSVAEFLSTAASNVGYYNMSGKVLQGNNFQNGSLVPIFNDLDPTTAVLSQQSSNGGVQKLLLFAYSSAPVQAGNISANSVIAYDGIYAAPNFVVNNRLDYKPLWLIANTSPWLTVDTQQNYSAYCPLYITDNSFIKNYCKANYSTSSCTYLPPSPPPPVSDIIT